MQARGTMLPSAAGNAEYLYTEGNGTSTGVFIANNGVHEYIAQADVHETFSFGEFANLERARASELVAHADREIALRGLVVTVVQEYSALVVAQEKYATAQQSSADALSFLDTTELLEKGREVAHADVVRARLQYQDREVAVRDAQYAMENARLQLAVLLFPNFNQDFQVVDNLASPTPLPPRQDAIALAEHNNPELRSVLQGANVARNEINSPTCRA